MSKGEQKLAEYAVSHQKLLEAAFHRFSEANIDSVKLSDIAADTGLTERTLFRHFDNKSVLVIETAAWVWKTYIVNARQRFAPGEWENMTAAQQYTFFLDSFLELYRKRRDLLCFNQMFNVYVRAAEINADNSAVVAHIFEVIARLTKEQGIESYRVVSNIGEQAGQSVPHLHFHVLSGRDMTWPPG